MHITKLTNDKSIEVLVHDCREADGAIEGAFINQMNAICTLAENLVKFHQHLVEKLVPIEELMHRSLTDTRYALAHELVKRLGPQVVGDACLAGIIIGISESRTNSDDIAREVQDQVWSHQVELLHPAAG